MTYTENLQKVATWDLPWEKLYGCNILVTGATGLIGSCLVEVLMLHPNKRFHVYAAGRDEERARQRFARFVDNDNFHFLHYDVTLPLQSEVDFHFVIHAASNASPNFFTHRPVEIIKANIIGLNNLIEYGMKHQMQRLLFVSTGEVYGEGDGRIFTEEYSGYIDPTSPRSCYPASKRAAETLCISYMAEYGVDVVIARPCHIYGPNFTESDNRVYAQFIRNVLCGEDIVMKSSGTQFRSWCYVADCVSALLHILLKGENGQAYNIADNASNISIRQLAELVAETTGHKVVMDIPSEEEKKGYNKVTKSVFSTEKIEALGWKPMTPINLGIKEIINYLLRDR